MKNISNPVSPLLCSIVLSAMLTACGTNSRHEQAASNQRPADPSGSLTVTAPGLPSLTEESRQPAEQVSTHVIQPKTERRDASQKLIQPRLMQIAPATGFSMSHPYTDHYSNIQDHENYAHYDSNGVIQTQIEPVSTISIDVDTGSYSNVRRLLNSGHLPVADAVRTEELINYFNYSYPATNGSPHPFTVHTESGPSPWAKNRHLLKIGIKATNADQENLPAANLVFLIDVSGSMSSADKLGLLKKSLSLLIAKLRPQDSISLVVYAGASGIVLEPTAGNRKHEILRALDNLTAGGSTNGGAGIELAYQVAQQAFKKNGINRILLATDGDFNVGTVNFEQLIKLVEKKRETSISLSTLGFGTGNYNDRLMEQLADVANGQYSYIDTLNEAQKVLIDEMSSTLKTVARDTKIQIEFNPQLVSEYRLIGYENRKLEKEDFNNDKVDAGDIGAGKTVTALYEIVLNETSQSQIDPLRYKTAGQLHNADNRTDELAFVKIRYKNPGELQSQLMQHAVIKKQLISELAETSPDFRFASSVAGFAELLKGGKYQQSFNYQDVIRLASNAQANDAFGYRHEFIQMVRLAESLQGTQLDKINE